MKKILMIILIVLSVFTVSAKSYNKVDGFGIGLSAGYPVAGAAFKYGMGDFRIVGTLGYSFKDSLAIEAGVQYDLDRFYIDRLPIYMNIGITGAVNFNPVLEGFFINIPIGLSYFFTDAPMELFFKLTPGVKIRSNSAEPDFGAAIGVLFYITH